MVQSSHDLITFANLDSRIRAAAANRPRPASPSNFMSTSIACLTAIYREASYAQYIPPSRRSLKVPPIGTIILLTGYLAWVILLEFVNNDVPGAQHHTSLGVRAAWLGVAQVPLLILLAGKNNLIGLVSGVSYERLNVIHRWVSRVLLLLATLHVINLHIAWNMYGLLELEYSTDSCIPTGWLCTLFLLWMNLSTLAQFEISRTNFSLFNIWSLSLVLLSLLCSICQAQHYIQGCTSTFPLVYIFWTVGFVLPGMLGTTATSTSNIDRPGWWCYQNRCSKQSH